MWRRQARDSTFDFQCVASAARQRKIWFAHRHIFPSIQITYNYHVMFLSRGGVEKAIFRRHCLLCAWVQLLHAEDRIFASCIYFCCCCCLLICISSLFRTNFDLWIFRAREHKNMHTISVVRVQCTKIWSIIDDDLLNHTNSVALAFDKSSNHIFCNDFPRLNPIENDRHNLFPSWLTAVFVSILNKVKTYWSRTTEQHIALWVHNESMNE